MSFENDYKIKNFAVPKIQPDGEVVEVRKSVRLGEAKDSVTITNAENALQNVSPQEIERRQKILLERYERIIDNPHGPYNSADSCRIAIDRILSGKMGAVEDYLLVLDKLSTKLQTFPESERSRVKSKEFRARNLMLDVLKEDILTVFIEQNKGEGKLQKNVSSLFGKKIKSNKKSDKLVQLMQDYQNCDVNEFVSKVNEVTGKNLSPENLVEIANGRLKYEKALSNFEGNEDFIAEYEDKYLNLLKTLGVREVDKKLEEFKVFEVFSEVKKNSDSLKQLTPVTQDVQIAPRVSFGGSIFTVGRRVVTELVALKKVAKGDSQDVTTYLRKKGFIEAPSSYLSGENKQIINNGKPLLPEQIERLGLVVQSKAKFTVEEINDIITMKSMDEIKGFIQLKEDLTSYRIYLDSDFRPEILKRSFIRENGQIKINTASRQKVFKLLKKMGFEITDRDEYFFKQVDPLTNLQVETLNKILNRPDANKFFSVSDIAKLMYKRDRAYINICIERGKIFGSESDPIFKQVCFAKSADGKTRRFQEVTHTMLESMLPWEERLASPDRVREIVERRMGVWDILYNVKDKDGRYIRDMNNVKISYLIDAIVRMPDQTQKIIDLAVTQSYWSDLIEVLKAPNAKELIDAYTAIGRYVDLKKIRISNFEAYDFNPKDFDMAYVSNIETIKIINPRKLLDFITSAEKYGLKLNEESFANPKFNKMIRSLIEEAESATDDAAKSLVELKIKLINKHGSKFTDEMMLCFEKRGILNNSLLNTIYPIDDVFKLLRSDDYYCYCSKERIIEALESNIAGLNINDLSYFIQKDPDLKIVRRISELNKKYLELLSSDYYKVYSLDFNFEKNVDFLRVADGKYPDDFLSLGLLMRIDSTEIEQLIKLRTLCPRIDEYAKIDGDVVVDNFWKYKLEDKELSLVAELLNKLPSLSGDELSKIALLKSEGLLTPELIKLDIPVEKIFRFLDLRFGKGIKIIKSNIDFLRVADGKYPDDFLKLGVLLRIDSTEIEQLIKLRTLCPRIDEYAKIDGDVVVDNFWKCKLEDKELSLVAELLNKLPSLSGDELSKIATLKSGGLLTPELIKLDIPVEKIFRFLDLPYGEGIELIKSLIMIKEKNPVIYNKFKQDIDISSKNLIKVISDFIDYVGISNINELSISAKKVLLKKLVATNADLFSLKNVTSDFPMIPTSAERYCELLPALVRSIGIQTNKLNGEQINRFNEGILDLGGSLSRLSDESFNSLRISQEYQMSSFIEDIISKITQKNKRGEQILPESEIQKIYDYFGFEIAHNKNGFRYVKGYPVNLNNGVKLAEISNPETKRIIEEVRPIVQRYSEQNRILCNDENIERILNGIIEGLPEVRSTINRLQHGTHSFDVFQHSLKVMQKIVQDENYAKLSMSDKKVMMLSSLLHDITKVARSVDKTHASESAFDAAYIVKKFNLTRDEEIKLYTLIRHHEWLEYANTARTADGKIDTGLLTKRLQSIAYDLRHDNIFEMALMFTHADLRAVKASDAFHDILEGAGRISQSGEVKSFGQLADEYADIIRKYIDELKISQPLLPVTKFPPASRIRSAIKVVNPDGSTNIKGVYVNQNGVVILKYNEIEDWETIGFPRGSISKGIESKENEFGSLSSFNTGNINFFVHGLDYPNQLAKFDAFHMADSDVLLSTSYAERVESKYKFFRAQGVILDVDTKYIHAGGETDAGSGCGKMVEEIKRNYIFGGYRHSDRVYVSNLIKGGTGMTDEQYIQFVAHNLNKSIQELTYPPNFEFAKKMSIGELKETLVKIYASINSRTRKGERAYNEMYLSNPRVMGVFAYPTFSTNNINATEQMMSLVEHNGFLQDYAKKNDLPFLVFGD